MGEAKKITPTNAPPKRKTFRNKAIRNRSEIIRDRPLGPTRFEPESCAYHRVPPTDLLPGSRGKTSGFPDSF